MDVFDASEIAKKVVVRMFADDRPFNISVEEASTDSDGFSIVVSFSREWDQLGGAMSSLLKPSRIFKDIRLRSDGELIAVKGRNAFAA